MTLGIGVLLLIGLMLIEKKNPVVTKNQLKTLSVSNKKSLAKIVLKTFDHPLFSINYPSDLSPYSDRYFCDAPSGIPCSEPMEYIAFLNKEYNSKSSNNEVNRIDIYRNIDINKVNLQIINNEEIVIGANHFTKGKNIDWLGGTAYWIQGKGYALRFTFRVPIENLTYSKYIDLTTLKIK